VDTKHIRNFCIIAHIDHGKSTLADRMLEITGAVDKRDMRAQLLDSMDLERERGITIKASAVTICHEYGASVRAQPDRHARPRGLQLRGPEVLQACEGALLLVDASQGVEARPSRTPTCASTRTSRCCRCSTRSTCPRAARGRARRRTRTRSASTRRTPARVGKTGKGVPELLDRSSRPSPRRRRISSLQGGVHAGRPR
jgi:GTP-binding protein LepA